MSRPFSYNDENFTTIGNLLVIHFRDDYSRQLGEPVFEVPSSIYKRMVTNSFMLAAQTAGESASMMCKSYIFESKGKHFISFYESRPRSNFPRYYIGFTHMKDI